MSLGPVIYAGLMVCSFVAPLRAWALDEGSASGNDAPVRVAARGAYVDSSGKQHPWFITSAHTLRWDNAPWIPTGLCFTPASLAVAGASTESQAEDDRTLDRLQASGIQDLLLQGGSTDGSAAGALPLQDMPASTLQAALDMLDKKGFRYGIDLHATLPGASDGYSFGELFVAGKEGVPGTYTAPATDGAASGLYIARDGTGSVVRMGLAVQKDGSFEMTAPANTVSVSFVNLRHWGAAEGVANLWEGFPECRDKILTALHQLKPGAGLRFFLNPMDGPLAPTGRAAYFYPASHHFRIGYEAWLRRRYATIEALCRKWGMAPDALPDFETAARLAPDAAVRPDAAWDPEKDSTLSMNAATSSFWTDFETFRMAATQHDMNTLADSIRQNIAEVPVLYRWQRFNFVYGEGLDPVAFDGLAANPAGAGDRAERAAAFAYAQAADSNRNRWFMMYGGNDWTLGRLANLADLGTKGFFLPQAGPAAGDDATLALIRSLRLSIFGAPAPAATRTASTAPSLQFPVRDTNYANYQPNILWFPWDLKVASVRRLPDGTWWLPTFRGGDPVVLGPNLEAYQVADGKFNQIALWAPRGPQTLHLRLPLSARVVWPADLILGRADRDGVRSISIGNDPLVLEGVGPADVFPADVLDKALLQADQLKNSLLIEQQNRQRLELSEASARRMKDAGLYYNAYVILSNELDLQRRILLPFAWIEGEKAVGTNLSGVARSSQCSGGQYLWLNNPDDPPAGNPYSATWTFSGTVPGGYDMWMGGTSPAQDWSSPVQWTLDGAPLMVQSHGPAGPPYGPTFHWAPLGEVYLSAGTHTLVATVTGRRLQPDDSYVLGIDAIAFSPGDMLVRDYLKGNGTVPAVGGKGSTHTKGGHRTPQVPGEPDIVLPDVHD